MKIKLQGEFKARSTSVFRCLDKVTEQAKFITCAKTTYEVDTTDPQTWTLTVIVEGEQERTDPAQLASLIAAFNYQVPNCHGIRNDLITYKFPNMNTLSSTELEFLSHFRPTIENYEGEGEKTERVNKGEGFEVRSSNHTLLLSLQTCEPSWKAKFEIYASRNGGQKQNIQTYQGAER